MFKLDSEIQKLIFDPMVGKLISLVAAFLVIYLITRSAKKYLTSKVSNTNTRYRTRKMINFVAFILLLLTAGFIFSDKLSNLTVAFGLAGAGIAFALKEVIASIAGWFAINFNGVFNVGDRVQLGGIKGDVIDIGVLRTTIMEIGDWVKGDLYNGRTVKVSNSFVFNDPVFNYSADYPFVWDEIDILIRHESDDVEAERIIKTAAIDVVGDFEQQSKNDWKNLVKKFMIEDARIENFISVTIDGNGINFTLRYITDFKSRRRTKDLLFRKINNAFKASQGKVEWSVSALELSSRPPIQIEVAK